MAMKSKMMVTALVATIGAAVCLEAWAQQRPENYIRHRKAAMALQVWYFQQLAGVAKGQRPYNKDEVVRAAGFLETVSQIAWEAFEPGTDKGATRAKPEIWSEADKFKAENERFMVEAAKLSKVAKEGDLAQLRTQVGATAKVCDSCHDNFRSK